MKKIIILIAMMGLVLISGCVEEKSEESWQTRASNLWACSQAEFPYYWDYDTQSCKNQFEETGSRCITLTEWESIETTFSPKNITGNHSLRFICEDNVVTYNKSECNNREGFQYYYIKCQGHDEICTLCW